MKTALADLEERIRTLLADPANAATPMGTALRDLWQHLEDQTRRLERITQLADSYQSMEREQRRSMAERAERQLQRLSRIVKISDRYQAMLKESNARLAAMSHVDALTGVANRRALNEILEREIAVASRGTASFVIAMLDVDYFKVINDRHGHVTGDRALVAVARILSSGIRAHDVCGRWGGEEFLMVLPATTLADARQLLARKVTEIRAMEIGSPSGEAIRLTVSAGLAEYLPGESLPALLGRADAALYRAKGSGRDRVATTQELEAGLRTEAH